MYAIGKFSLQANRMRLSVLPGLEVRDAQATWKGASRTTFFLS